MRHIARGGQARKDERDAEVPSTSDQPGEVPDELRRKGETPLLAHGDDTRRPSTQRHIPRSSAHASIELIHFMGCCLHGKCTPHLLGAGVSHALNQVIVCLKISMTWQGCKRTYASP